MTDEHVWVTLADGKRLYVGKRKLIDAEMEAAADALKAKLKRKRRQHPPPAPVEFNPVMLGVRDAD